MNGTAAAERPACDGSLERMMALACRRDGIASDEPRRVLLERVSRQMLLFSRMSERLGVAVPESPLMRAALREIEFGCLECTAWQRCRHWLAGHSSGDDYRDFCPNEGLFAALCASMRFKHP